MTMMETLKAAIGDVKSKPLAPFIGAAVVVVWLSLFYLWLGLPLSGFAGLAAVVVGGMALAGGLGVMVQQSLTLYRDQTGKVVRLLAAGEFWVAALAFLLLGAAAPYGLIYWVPELSGLGMQAASAAVRFAAAVLLFVTMWLLLCAVMRRVMERGGTDEIDPDRPLDLSR